jgi:subtilisin family serine protease
MNIFSKLCLNVSVLTIGMIAPQAFSNDDVEYIVKLKPGFRALQQNANLLAAKSFSTSFGKFQVIKASSTDSAMQSALASDPSIEYMEPNHKYSVLHDDRIHVSQTRALPGDPRESEQWALTFLNADQAWTMTRGSSQIIVAVLDSGIYYDHVDLTANIWTNQLEKDGQSGVDDDGNGYIDDIHGYDFAYNDADPKDGDGHGTHCAGSIGAMHDNNEGIKGINADIKLMAVQLSYVGGATTLDKILRAIDYAIKMHADVMTNSWTGVEDSRLLKDAIAAAGNAGIPFVEAAGNEHKNIDTSPIYPTSYKLENMFIVGAHDKNGVMPTFSNFGSGTVDILAPGVEILSTTNKTNWRPFWYRPSSGTSMSTPFVAGAIAMLYAKEGKIPFATIRERLIRTSRNASQFAGKSKGGTLDLANFLSNGQ